MRTPSPGRARPGILALKILDTITAVRGNAGEGRFGQDSGRRLTVDDQREGQPDQSDDIGFRALDNGSELREALTIGRELPLAQLLDDFKLVLGGTGRMCLLTGDAGVGKTRLLREFLSRLQAYECFVLSGRAHEYDHGVAYASLRDQLASAPSQELDTTTTQEVEQLHRALDAAALGRTDATRSVGLQPAYLLTTKLLTSLSRARPTVVVLDDAHLADDESLTALALAARRLGSVPLFLVFTARRDQWLPGSSFAATVGRLIEVGLGHTVQLDVLDQEDITALIGSVLSVRPGQPLTSYVFAQSRGNPLFAREAIRSLLEAKAIRTEHGRGHLVGNPAAGTVSARAALLHRVFRQDRAGRELARVMSAYRHVHTDQLPTLATITGLDRKQVESAFDSLVKASIVTVAGRGTYEFTHPLMAEVLYKDLGPLERRRLHKLIAESLRDQHPQDSTDILDWTLHVAEAAAPGDPTALRAVIDAAMLTRNTAPLSAATWFERSVDLLTPAAPERAELLSRQAVALWKGSRPEAAVRIGTEALPILPIGAHRTRTLATVINANYAMGCYADALKLIEAELDDSDAPASFQAQGALLLAHTGRTHEAATQRARAIRSAARGPLAEQTVTYSFLGHVANSLGDYAGVRGAIDKLVELGHRREKELTSGARLSALESAAYLLSVTGCLDEARTALSEVGSLLPETGFQDIGGQNIYTKAKTEHLTGEWDAALDTIRTGVISLDFAGLKNNLAWLRMLEAEILTDQSHLDDAARIVRSQLLSEDCVLYEMLRQVRSAKISVSLGEIEDAERVLRHQASAARDSGLADPLRLSLEALVDLYATTGQTAAARRYASELDDHASQTRSPATVLAADLAISSLGDRPRAERLLEQAEGEDRRFLAAQAHFHLGSMAVDPEIHLPRALDLFGSVGAVQWTRRASARAKALGLPVTLMHRRAGGPSQRSDSARLTPTEVEIVKLVQQSLTNRQISSVLHYSTKTVEVYLSRLYQKVGCHSRVELVLAAERGELIGFDL